MLHQLDSKLLNLGCVDICMCKCVLSCSPLFFHYSILPLFLFSILLLFYSSSILYSTILFRSPSLSSILLVFFLYSSSIFFLFSIILYYSLIFSLSFHPFFTWNSLQSKLQLLQGHRIGLRRHGCRVPWRRHLEKSVLKMVRFQHERWENPEALETRHTHI